MKITQPDQAPTTRTSQPERPTQRTEGFPETLGEEPPQDCRHGPSQRAADTTSDRADACLGAPTPLDILARVPVGIPQPLNQRTSGTLPSEEALECSLRISRLEVEVEPARRPVLEATSAAAREASGTAGKAPGEATCVIAPFASSGFEALLAELVIDGALVGVGQDLVRLGDFLEPLGSPLFPIAILIRVVFKCELPEGREEKARKLLEAGVGCLANHRRRQ